MSCSLQELIFPLCMEQQATSKETSKSQWSLLQVEHCSSQLSMKESFSSSNRHLLSWPWSHASGSAHTPISPTEPWQMAQWALTVYAQSPCSFKGWTSSTSRDMTDLATKTAQEVSISGTSGLSMAKSTGQAPALPYPFFLGQHMLQGWSLAGPCWQSSSPRKGFL